MIDGKNNTTNSDDDDDRNNNIDNFTPYLHVVIVHTVFTKPTIIIRGQVVPGKGVPKTLQFTST